MFRNKRTLTISSNQRVVFIFMTMICFIFLVFYSELFSSSKEAQGKNVRNEQVQNVQDAQTNVQTVQHSKAQEQNVQDAQTKVQNSQAQEQNVQDTQTKVQSVQNAQSQVQNAQNNQNIIDRPPIASLRKEDNVCVKGNPPVTKEWIKGQLKEFLAVLKKKPVEDEKFTSGVMHVFALWCMVRHLQPEYIVESGVHRGLGTWILRQAAPNAKLVLLDPRYLLGNKDWTVHYIDTKPDTRYFVGPNFTDFAQMDWKKYIDPAKTFAYIDDHQNPVRRIQESSDMGFKHLMFDDNYWYGGDMISLKVSCALLMNELRASDVVYRDDFAKVERDVTEHDLAQMYGAFDGLIDVYYEFPMIVYAKASTNMDTKHYLFPQTDISEVFKEYGYMEPVDERFGSQYTGILYVRLK